MLCGWGCAIGAVGTRPWIEAVEGLCDRVALRGWADRVLGVKVLWAHFELD